MKKNKKESGGNLHGSPVIRKEGNCISQVSIVLCPHAISIILIFVASSYIVACYILQVSEQWNLFMERKYYHTKNLFYTLRQQKCSRVDILSLLSSKSLKFEYHLITFYVCGCCWPLR